MSKMAAVDTALVQELVHENRPPPATYQEVMGKQPYNYVETTIKVLLANVAMRLRGDSPSYSFAWENLDATTCLSDTVSTFEYRIFSATS